MQSVTSGAVYNKLSWKILNGNTLPNEDDYEEISISVYFQQDINTEVLYSNTYAKGQLGGTQNIVVGGYYINSYDFGLCNLNLINGNISIRNCYFGGQNITSSVNLRIRYR